LSHGCIRLERPMDLAHVLLQGSEWTPEKLQEEIASGAQKSIDLPKPLPVHILYFTAWVDKGGTVHFRRDLYGHDAKLARALAEEPIVELDLDAVRGQVRASGAAQGSPITDSSDQLIAFHQAVAVPTGPDEGLLDDRDNLIDGIPFEARRLGSERDEIRSGSLQSPKPLRDGGGREVET
jgi:hypothetical protein